MTGPLLKPVARGFPYPRQRQLLEDCIYWMVSGSFYGRIRLLGSHREVINQVFALHFFGRNSPVSSGKPPVLSYSQYADPIAQSTCSTFVAWLTFAVQMISGKILWQLEPQAPLLSSASFSSSFLVSWVGPADFSSALCWCIPLPVLREGAVLTPESVAVLAGAEGCGSSLSVFSESSGTCVAVD